MDVARCRCVGSVRHTACPFHGDCSPTPIKPYRLSESDRDLLKSMRIALEDIEEVRKADEDRFRRD